MLVEKIGYEAMLEQTAEECTELAQACLKLARKIRNENPTPKTIEQCYENLYEEMADVLLCFDEIQTDEFNVHINKWKDVKKVALQKRIAEIDAQNCDKIIW